MSAGRTRLTLYVKVSNSSCESTNTVGFLGHATYDPPGPKGGFLHLLMHRANRWRQYKHPWLSVRTPVDNHGWICSQTHFYARWKEPVATGHRRSNVKRVMTKKHNVCHNTN